MDTRTLVVQPRHPHINYCAILTKVSIKDIEPRVDDLLGVDDPMAYEFRITVGGSRDATCDAAWFANKMLWVLRQFPDKDKVLIIDGKAKGIDDMANDFAKKHCYAYKRYPAEWEKYKPEDPSRKNPAGMIRNGDMLKVSTHYVAFWDYVSRGTGGAIRLAEKLKIKHIVIRLPKDKNDDSHSEGRGNPDTQHPQ